MGYFENYKEWLEKADVETVNELTAISDEQEIEDRFYRDLEFGTGGLRGIMGAGINRMNKYTVGKATQGLGDYIKYNGQECMARGVVIAYDSRNNSKEFAEHTGKILSSNGIKTYIFDCLHPTPMLSFAVRFLKCFAGVVITASHNPKEYNGYKIYAEDGGQLPVDAANNIFEYIAKVDIFDVVINQDAKLNIIGSDVDEAYYEAVMKQSKGQSLNKDDLKIIYTPLHGSGNIPVREIFKRTGFENVSVIESQEQPDGDFPTVKTPNPENKECFIEAIKEAEKNGTDIIIGTDPDCDRVGVVVRTNEGIYKTLTGNQVGALLTDYMLNRNVSKNDAVVSTVVSSRLIKEICNKKGATYFDVLTGFKFIGEKIHQFEMDESFNFVLGVEESYGYLAGTYARDKDAVVASMLICEMTAFYKDMGKTLTERLDELYLEYGFHYEELISLDLKGIQGRKIIAEIMEKIRTCDDIHYGIIEKIDYLHGIDMLPKSNVVKVLFDNECSFIARPSGTEPKIKFYIHSKGTDKDDAINKSDILKSLISQIAETNIS